MAFYLAQPVQESRWQEHAVQTPDHRADEPQVTAGIMEAARQQGPCTKWQTGAQNDNG